jgi:hypothetical protein
MRRMHFLNLMRREAARATLDAIGEAIAVDLVRARGRRSRRQHLRNGVGAILQATSRVAWRPTPSVTFFYLTRASVQSQFRYGLDELRRGLLPSSAQARRALALAAVSSLAATVAVVIRMRRDDGEDQPPASSPAEPTLAGARR